MSRRGQLVLLAAFTVAVALVPMAFAYHQLGYHEDVRAGGPDDDPTAGALAALDRATHDTTADVPGQFRWDQRDAAVAAIRTRLADPIERIEEARLHEGIARGVEYNHSHARVWRGWNCQSGPDRQFGDCEAIDGVVVQERAGWTHVLGVAFDVESTSDRSHTELTTVVQPAGEDR